MSEALSSEDGVLEDRPRLSEEMQAAMLLLHHLRDMGILTNDPADDDLAADTIEGQTNLMEAIGFTLEAIAEDRLMIAGIKQRRHEMEERQRRLEERTERRQWAVEVALNLARKRNIKHPLCELVVAKSPPRVEVVAEEWLPSRFFRQTKAAVDKRRLLAEVKALGAIPGATLIENETHVRYKWS